jgi:hypothetical protein
MTPDLKELLKQANAQTELANKEIEKQEEQNKELVVTLSKIYLGTIGIMDSCVENIRKVLKDSSINLSELDMFTGQVYFIRNFIVGYSTLYQAMYQGFGMTASFTEEVLKVNNKLIMLADAIDAKREIIVKGE